MVNKALKTTFKQLIVAIPSVAGDYVIGATYEPYVDVVPSLNRVVLHAEQVFYDEAWAYSKTLCSVYWDSIHVCASYR
ncbi:MAG: hypothetical protein ACKPKO_33390 [Candidatus Fonsibacter sp.]